MRVIGDARAGHAPAGVENPERQPAVVETQRPALAACKIDEGEFRLQRTDQPMLGADAAQIIKRRAIAGKQEMIAVVDRHAERGIVIGAAATAGEGGSLVHDERFAERCKPHGRRQSGEAGADDVDRSAHPVTRDYAAR